MRWAQKHSRSACTPAVCVVWILSGVWGSHHGDDDNHTSGSINQKRNNNRTNDSDDQQGSNRKIMRSTHQHRLITSRIVDTAPPNPTNLHGAHESLNVTRTWSNLDRASL